MSCSYGIGIIIWIYLLNITVRGQLLPGPNAIALINCQTKLDCSTINLALSNWQYTPNGANNSVTIASGCNPVTGNNAAYYRTELQGVNTCRLIIGNVTMQQAGIYSCYNGVTFIYQSLVTVIDSAASVVVYNRSDVVDADQLNISCSIDYNGPASPAPSLRPLPYWTTSPGQTFTSAISYPSTNVVTLISTVTVQKPTVPIFQCGTEFAITGNVIGYNSTPPADNFTVGTTTELVVRYYASKPTIHVTKGAGTSCGTIVLTCNSLGNPVPMYKWYYLNETVNVLIIGEQILTLVAVNRSYMYMCEAYNTIRNSSWISSAHYNVSESDFSSYCGNTSPVTSYLPVDPSTTIGLAAGLGGYGLLNIIATFVFLWYYNRKSKNVRDGREIYTFRNKSRLNGRFPWLQSMLPCLNESRGNAGCSFLWVLLFILMSLLAGIIVFPILVAMANCSGERNDVKEDSDIGMGNVYQEDTIGHRGAAKSNTDAHGHVEAPYDEIGTVHLGRKVVLEEESASSNNKNKKVFYTKVNPNFNAEEGVERYSVSLPS